MIFPHVEIEIQVFCPTFENDPKGCGLFIRRQSKDCYLIIRKGLTSNKALIKLGAGYTWTRIYDDGDIVGESPRNLVITPTLDAALTLIGEVYGP